MFDLGCWMFSFPSSTSDPRQSSQRIRFLRLADARAESLNHPAAGVNSLPVNPRAPDPRTGLFSSLAGDGTPLLSLMAICLLLCGGFALFLSASGHFLPHDVRYLGIDKDQLCGINQCRIVHFMFHDRVSFGGALITIGWLYLWLAHFPLRAGEAWAWWVFCASGLAGFSSFLAYLGYGYLDSWHGTATLFLLPIYVGGMILSWRSIVQKAGPSSLLKPSVTPRLNSAFGLGRALLLLTGIGMMLGGTTILIVGMTHVFVPQDLKYIGLTARELHLINPHLVPLIAHDRAGFGGAIATCGLLLFLCVWRGQPSRALWQAIALGGSIGFATAIGIHPIIGYTDFSHLLPAYIGAALFVAGVCLCYKPMQHGEMTTPADSHRELTGQSV